MSNQIRFSIPSSFQAINNFIPNMEKFAQKRCETANKCMMKISNGVQTNIQDKYCPQHLLDESQHPKYQTLSSIPKNLKCYVIITILCVYM